MQEKNKKEFIVLNRKRFDEVFELKDDINKAYLEYVLTMLIKALDFFKNTFNSTPGLKKMDQKYYVCNQDEPYAQEVLDVILKGEKEKEKQKNKK